MDFGSVPVAQAQGAILAHSIDLGGKRLRKGRVLEAVDIAGLQRAGFDQVIVARLGLRRGVLPGTNMSFRRVS